MEIKSFNPGIETAKEKSYIEGLNGISKSAEQGEEQMMLLEPPSINLNAEWTRSARCWEMVYYHQGKGLESVSTDGKMHHL